MPETALHLLASREPPYMLIERKITGSNRASDQTKNRAVVQLNCCPDSEALFHCFNPPLV